MVEIDKEMLVKVLRGAGERVGKSAAQSLLKAIHQELARNGNTFSTAKDRVIAASCEDFARALKEEFAKIEADIAAVRAFLEQKR